MSARLNKKRKGRGNQITRERTVTTLTEGSEGSFMTTDEPQLNITSSPFSVASSSAGPPSTISPSFSMSSGFPGFSYGYVPGTVIPPASFGQSAQPAHFYPAQSLPPGQSDLEILERLKETIKNNQHELFAPVPRPAALASVYLGPHSVSHVPPHPEQIPQDYPSNPQNGRHARASSTASSSDARRATLAAGGSTQIGNKPALSSGLSLDSIDSSNKTMDIDPPGLNTPLGVTDISQRTPRLDHTSVGTAAKYDARDLGKSGTDKSLGEVSPSKASINIKEEPRRDRDPDWSQKGTGTSQEDAKNSRYENDKYNANGRPVGDTRYGNDNSRPPPRYQRGDYDREKSRERDRDRDWDRDRDHRRYEPTNRSTDRRNDDRFRSTDNRRPPPEQRHYEPRHDSRINDPLRRWESKSSVDSTTSPAARPLDTRPADVRPSRPLVEERSFDSRDGRPGEDRPSDSRGSRSLAQDRSFDSRGSRPLSTERHSDLRGPRPPLNDRPPPPLADNDRSGRSAAADDRRSYPPTSSDRPSRPIDAARAPPPSPSKPVVGDDRRPVNSSSAARPSEQRASLDDRKAPLSQTLSSSSVGGTDRRPPPPAFSRPSDSVPSSERNTRGSGDYPVRQRSASIADKGPRASSPVRPPPHSDRNAPPRSQLPLEDRISRPASLQERLGGRPSDAPPSVRPDGGRPPPSPAEQRPSAATHDDRRITSEHSSGSKLVADAAVNNANNARSSGPDTSRPPPPVSRDPPRPATQTIPPSRRSIGPPAQRLSYPSTTPVAPAPEDTFKPRGAPPSPRRSEYRPLDRATYPDRYERDASRERRPDPLDVEAPRFPDRAVPQSYTRPSPPPFSRPDERDWPPAREHPYPRHPHDPPPVHATYERDWRGDERTAYDAWEQRSKWDRERASESAHEFARDPRYFGRDSGGSWDAREPRDRYPPEEPPVARPYESRLLPRGPDVYADGRVYDRPRYPEASPPVGGAPRVRPRSPSPVRRAGIEDLQPPLKRPRDDAYGASYYPPPPSRELPRDYPPPASSIYYDDVPPSAARGGPPGERRDRAYRDRDYSPYDTRHAPAYARDDRRYG